MLNSQAVAACPCSVRKKRRIKPTQHTATPSPIKVVQSLHLDGLFHGWRCGNRALFLHFFPMDAHAFVSALLDCGYLDTDYLFRLTDAYGIEPRELMDDVHDFCP